MKNFLKGLLICSSLLLSFGCGNESIIATRAPIESTKKLLSGASWNIRGAVIDGSATDLYDGFTLSFSIVPSTYSSTNGGLLWPQSGTWSFLSQDGKKILRDDGLEITVESVTEKQLILTYYWASTTYDDARVGSLIGLTRITLDRE